MPNQIKANGTLASTSNPVTNIVPANPPVLIPLADIRQLLDEIEGMNTAIYDVITVLNIIRNGTSKGMAKAIASLSIDSLDLWVEITDKSRDNFLSIEGVKRG